MSDIFVKETGSTTFEARLSMTGFVHAPEGTTPVRGDDEVVVLAGDPPASRQRPPGRRLAESAGARRGLSRA
jgi:hypothetical protein